MHSTQKRRHTALIAGISATAILAHLLLRFGLGTGKEVHQLPLIACLLVGGGPLVFRLTRKLIRREFGSDLLAGISIVSSAFLGEYLAGAIVVLMLSGGEVLENYAVANASSVLRALAKRMPSIAHRKDGLQLREIPVAEVQVGDILVVFPHEISPVDGVVLEGHGRMDESFLTGEPFEMTKAPGAQVISGAVNGESALTIRAIKLPVDSRYAKIVEVMRTSEQNRPRIRRLGDQLGAFYTPIALAIALIAGVWSGDAVRFLAVLVVATPCPLLIAIPVAIIGSISLAARRGIIVKHPAVLEQMDRCRTVIFDKTGTLTYGNPKLTSQAVSPDFQPAEILAFAASLERYSKHPLARAVLDQALIEKVPLHEATEINEPPGQGLRGLVNGQRVEITHRKRLLERPIAGIENLPPTRTGLECVVLLNGTCAATYQFHDAPRADGVSFIQHLGPRHRFNRIMIVSGDRESEVRYLADQVGISEIHAHKSPEEKVAIVREASRTAPTLYVGDGINDAPAMMTANVGIAIGHNSDITTQAAGAVVMESELKKVDELMHISRRMRTIALQSAIGGMVLSLGGMALAAAGLLTPVAGALTQEIIDVLSISNALRSAVPPKQITDF